MGDLERGARGILTVLLREDAKTAAVINQEKLASSRHMRATSNKLF